MDLIVCKLCIPLLPSAPTSLAWVLLFGGSQIRAQSPNSSWSSTAGFWCQEFGTACDLTWLLCPGHRVPNLVGVSTMNKSSPFIFRGYNVRSSGSPGPRCQLPSLQFMQNPWLSFPPCFFAILLLCWHPGYRVKREFVENKSHSMAISQQFHLKFRWEKRLINNFSCLYICWPLYPLLLFS